MNQNRNSRTRSLCRWLSAVAVLSALVASVFAQVPGKPVVIAPGVWTVTPEAATIEAGTFIQLTSTSGGGTVWISANPAIATVDGSGVVVGVSEGVVLITARKDNKNGQSRITVTPAPEPEPDPDPPPDPPDPPPPPPPDPPPDPQPPGTAIVTLTTQEALYPGGSSGVARTNEPVTVGIPLPDDSSGVSDVSGLGLSGPTVGQFRELASWPSGRVKWALLDTQLPSLSAGGTSTAIAVTTGSGNFGGSNLATDNGTFITVATGTATFGIRKANFNGLDTVVVGSTTIVSSATSSGLVVTGPASPGTSCGTCTTLYTSANDSSSTAVIEENGPARVVIKATGQHKDGSGNPYMRYTVRMHFYKNKSYVRAVVSLQNADLGHNNFASAFKGHDSYEWRIVPNISGTTSYTMANDTSTPLTGTLSGTDDLYVYQAETTRMKWQDWCGFGCVTYSPDQGFAINRNGSNIDTGTAAEPVGGWADIRDSNGRGVQIGIYQMAAYWPKSLEFLDAGTDTRIGIWARQNSIPYYQSWPQHSIHTLFFNFHDSALSSPANDFLKFQHKLVARAPYAWYNTAAVFPWTLVDPTIETAYYTSVQQSAVPSISAASAGPYLDLGISSASWPLNIYRWYAWGAGGGSNQTEFRWSRLLNFLARGMTGRYLDSEHFYRHVEEEGEPRSDGFAWKNETSNMDGFNRPNRTSANDTLAHRNWRDQEHGHWYGLTDWYYMSGEREAYDAIYDGFLDWFSSPVATYQQGSIGGRSWTVNASSATITKTAGTDFADAEFYPGKSVMINGTVYYVLTRASTTQITVTPSPGTLSAQTMYSEGGLFNTRSVGVDLMGAARLYSFLVDQGDTANATIVAASGDRIYQSMILGANCANGRPASCSIATPDGGPFRTQGIQYDRGFHWGASGGSGTWCGNPHAYRVNSTFQTAVLISGLIEYSRARGAAWSEYVRARDIAYGLSQFANSELAVFNTSEWDDNGYRFGVAFDVANNCPGEDPEENFEATNNQTIWSIFTIDNIITGSTDWASRAAISLQRLMAALGATTSDFGSYLVNDVISRLSGTAGPELTTKTITGFTDLGGGSYTLTWAHTTGATYRIKWGTREIVDLIGFDPGDNVYTGDPTTEMNWFAANNVTTTPTCSSNCSVTVSTGTTGLTSANFSVKASAVAATVGSVTWVNKTHSTGWPGYNGYLYDLFDHVSGQVMHYGIRSVDSIIYSTDQFAYNTRNNVWTRIGGNTAATGCTVTWPSWPTNRHPDGQMAIDTLRNRMWMMGGVCGGINQQDMAYMTLNANPAANSWTRVTPANFPNPMNSAAMVYDSITDLLILFGPTSGSILEIWVYAPSATVSAAQIAAGATSAQNWIKVTFSGGPFSGDAYPRAIYSVANQKTVIFGGLNNSTATNEVWTYTTSTKTLAQRCTSPCSPPPVYTGPASPPTFAFVEIPVAGLFFYHQTHGSGAPKDWTFTLGASAAADVWSALTSTGSGPTADAVATYDSTNGAIFLWTRNASTGEPDVWIGTFTPGSSAMNPPRKPIVQGVH